jgi:hypothetical protein
VQNRLEDHDQSIFQKRSPVFNKWPGITRYPYGKKVNLSQAPELTPVIPATQEHRDQEDHSSKPAPGK